MGVTNVPTTPNPDRVSLARQRELIAEHRRITGRIGPDQDRLKQIESAIKATMGEAITGTINGKPVVEWTRSTRDRIDTKTLQLENPEIARKYVVTSTVRTFKVLPDA
jgi:predicted phage-related endonuclease